MLAKLTAKDQISVPRDVLSGSLDVGYFDVACRIGMVTLKSVKVTDEDLTAKRKKIRKLSLLEDCVTEAARRANSR